MSIEVSTLENTKGVNIEGKNAFHLEDSLSDDRQLAAWSFRMLNHSIPSWSFNMKPIHPMITMPFSIQRIHRETHDTFTFEFIPVENNKKILFNPGQFNMLYVFGVGEVPISISGDPAHQGGFTHTIREVGNVTGAIVRMKKGDIIGIRGPFGNPWPIENAEDNDVVIIAGGIGLAPLRPVIYSLLSTRKKYGKIILLYGARTPQDLLYRNELERWRGRFDLYVDVTVDSATTDWRGNVGVVTALLNRADFDPLHTISMICGPEIMMRFAIKEMIKRGVRKNCIFLSMERNMKCGIGLCGHCQFGPNFICKDGPVFSYDHVQLFMSRREI